MRLGCNDLCRTAMEPRGQLLDDAQGQSDQSRRASIRTSPPSDTSQTMLRSHGTPAR